MNYKGGKKKCIKCKKIKKIVDFYLRKEKHLSKWIRRAKCKKCCHKESRPKMKIYYQKYKGKQRARAKLHGEIKSGKIKIGKCKVCKTDKNIHGHHTDYRKPLQVIWLCRQHHEDLHHKK